MKTPEEIKNEYEQNHYRKQRELIDAGKLDYWGLTEGNRKAILKQCRKEARKYPSLRWRVSDQGEYPKKGYTDIGGEWSFHCLHLYYRRVDPLPEEVFTEEIEDLKIIKLANQANIKTLEKEVEKYKKALSNCENDKLRLEKELSQQIRQAKVATERVEELVKEKKALEEWTSQERITLLQDIRTLAMR